MVGCQHHPPVRRCSPAGERSSSIRGRSRGGVRRRWYADGGRERPVRQRGSTGDPSGGTGNAMAHELNVPLVLKEAAQLIVSSRKCRSVDLAKMGDRVFMLRAYTGITADVAAS